MCVNELSGCLACNFIKGVTWGKCAYACYSPELYFLKE